MQGLREVRRMERLRRSGCCRDGIRVWECLRSGDVDEGR